MKDLDESFLETRYFEAILDPTDQSYWVYFGTDVFKQPTNERCENISQKNRRQLEVRRTRSRFCVFQEILPKIIIILFLGKLDSLGKEPSRTISLVP